MPRSSRNSSRINRKSERVRATDDKSAWADRTDRTKRAIADDVVEMYESVFSISSEKRSMLANGGSKVSRQLSGGAPLD